MEKKFEQILPLRNNNDNTDHLLKKGTYRMHKSPKTTRESNMSKKHNILSEWSSVEHSDISGNKSKQKTEPSDEEQAFSNDIQKLEAILSK